MAKSIHSSWILIGLLALGCGAPEAQDFSVESMDSPGKRVTLSSFKGKVVVLDFWATWCTPCVASMPKLGAMYQRLKDKGLVVMGITSEDRTTVNEFLAQRKVAHPLFLDTTGEMGGPTTKFDVTVLPTMVIIDRKGNVFKREVGYSGDLSKIEAEIEKLL
jgi:thiol-disulfide isomerase/thioredoxin